MGITYSSMSFPLTWSEFSSFYTEFTNMQRHLFNGIWGTIQVSAMVRCTTTATQDEGRPLHRQLTGEPREKGRPLAFQRDSPLCASEKPGLGRAKAD